MRRLMVAVMFLTRIPLHSTWNVGAVDVGRSSAFFPLIGAAIGTFQSLLLWGSLRFADYAGSAFGRRVSLPAAVLSVLITAAGVWITRALHLDGVADTADGFGGGRTREETLSIMREHQIGSFGAVALFLVLATKITSIAALIDRGAALPYLILAPGLARASVVVLGSFLSYARSDSGGLGSTLKYIGPTELVLSSLTSLALLLLVGWWRGIICVLVVMVISFANAWICMRRIGGMTGDTLGANSEICEALILAAGSILSS